jgi:hypothetical protein
LAQGLFTAQSVITTGLSPTLSAVSASGDLYVNTGYEVIYATNAESSANTITIAATKKCDYGEMHDKVISIGAGSTIVAGKFETRWYNNVSDKVTMTYATASGLTLGVLQVI